MSDLIERDALMKEICGNECGSVCDEECEKVMCNFYDYIMDAPAVNRWIPCSEKCPESIGMVLITWVNRNPPSYYAEIKDKPQTGAGHYFNGKWFWHSSVSEDHIAEYGHAFGIDCMDDKIEVIAWMPMPDAYEPPESEVQE